MKVICIIDLSNIRRDPRCIDSSLPIMNNIYTVTDETITPTYRYYSLKGFKDIYSVEFFAPLDDYLDQFTANLVEELENCQLIEA